MLVTLAGVLAVTLSVGAGPAAASENRQHVDPHVVGLPPWVPITPQIQAEADRGDTWSYSVDAVDPALVLPPGGKSPFEARHADATCGTGSHVWNNFRTLFPFHWKYNPSAEPTYLDHANTVTSLRGAKIEWELSQNWCNFPDTSAANFTYDGETSQSFDFATGGLSTIGFGNMNNVDPGCVPGPYAYKLCLGIEIDRQTGPPTYTVEADIRMMEGSPAGYRWSNIQASGKWDPQGVAAHETGHALGFEHVCDTTNIMVGGDCFTLQPGDYSLRLLGYGDWYVNGVVY